MFSKISSRYDLLNRLLSFYQDVRWRKIATEKIKRCIPPSSIILDTCTGTGDLAIAIDKSIKDAFVIGVDFSFEMLRICQKKAEKKRSGKVFNLLADCLHLPFKKNTFDAVTTAFGFRNLEDRINGANEMLRVLKPGGKLLILEFSMPSNPLFSLLYKIYMAIFLPFIGFTLSGTDAYYYLKNSVFSFPQPQEIKNLLENAGAVNVSYFRKTFGSVTFYLGEKK